MNTESLTKSIKLLESTIENLEKSKNPKDGNIIERITNIQMELIERRNQIINSFDRTKELKSLLDKVLKHEGFGYDTASQIFKESNINNLLTYQYDNGYYTLSNGEKISKDFRIIMYLYLNA
jgi:hypothetical protein